MSRQIKRRRLDREFDVDADDVVNYAELMGLTGHLALNLRRFKALFGFEPSLLAYIWNVIRVKAVRQKLSLRYFLATFHFVKVYCPNLTAMERSFSREDEAILPIVERIARLVNCHIKDEVRLYISM